MDRTPRSSALALLVALQFAAAACISSRVADPGADPSPARRTSGVALRPLVLASSDLRLAAANGSVHDALAVLQPEILYGRHSASVVRSGQPAAVYVNGLLMRDAEALRSIAVSRVRRVEVVPLFGEPRSRASRYQPGTIHVTLLPIQRDPLMSGLRTLH